MAKLKWELKDAQLQAFGNELEYLIEQHDDGNFWLAIEGSPGCSQFEDVIEALQHAQNFEDAQCSNVGLVENAEDE